MDLHQLETFVVVAREGSITRASELLHLSQPAVSAHIKTIIGSAQHVQRNEWDCVRRGECSQA